MNYQEKALSLGHIHDIVQKFIEFRQSLNVFDAEHIAELMTIFFLPHITWGTNFELIEEMIKDAGNKYRIGQWIKQLNGVDVMDNKPGDITENRTILQQMWELDALPREELDETEQEFYKANLPVIKAYYAKNAAYWTTK